MGDGLDVTSNLDLVPPDTSAGTDPSGTGSDQVELGNAIVQESLGAQIVQGTQQELLGQGIVDGTIEAFNAGAGQGIAASGSSAGVPVAAFILPASLAAIKAVQSPLQMAARPPVFGSSVGSPGSVRRVASITASVSAGELIGLAALVLLAGYAAFKLA